MGPQLVPLGKRIRRRIGERDGSAMWAQLSVRVVCIPVGIIDIPVRQIVSGFNLDRDLQVQGTNDRDLEFRVHFAKPLRVQGLI
jgi:hypothetical protein